MGWKTLKDAFGIQKHTVSVSDKGMCIGGYVADLVTINTATGTLVESTAFNGFLARTYPELAKASPADLLVLIRADDTFSASITVYTYQDGDIVEKQCEEAGWPNVTFDGEIMYENTYSTDKQIVIGWAKRNARLEVSHTEECLARLHTQVAGAETDLMKSRGFVAKLEADYPDVPAAG
jgi:hypothetical protein